MACTTLSLELFKYDTDPRVFHQLPYTRCNGEIFNVAIETDKFRDVRQVVS
ncbi:hypothetical protein I3U44_07545 [Mycobacteroides abscessus subsp. bolletii]|uniref:hypothetical protein n=1 Tax=Mycobacteroides abscessus TaxID=36809 RepID=UPI0013F646E0|nr:hypothetical protein [Mycobacteroides abscessus]QSM90514.1 hypothetical protein I3U44_07545 [Mycobacteroides abscessus subsp. bolletii]